MCMYIPLLLLLASQALALHSAFQVSVLPPLRCSTYVKPDLLVYYPIGSASAALLEVEVIQHNKSRVIASRTVTASETLQKIPLTLTGWTGSVQLSVNVIDPSGMNYSKVFPYQIVDSGVVSTQLVSVLVLAYKKLTVSFSIHTDRRSLDNDCSL